MKWKKPDLTYRTRKRLKTAGIVLGNLVALCFLVWLVWILWLGRFVVYGRDAVRLDFEWVTPGAFVEAVQPEEMPVNIIFDDGSQVIVDRNKPLAQISGFYVTAEMLTGDVEEVERLIREQPKGTAIMLELKGGTGNFYYKTNLPDATVSSRIDQEAVENLIKYLAKADYYTVACVSSLRDRAYGLKNTTYGVHHSSGRYLWAGEDKCYWLDPTKNGTRSWLVSVATELRDLGFDEVLFADFSFPPTEDILFDGDKAAALNETAQHLVNNLATETFGVSFLCNDPDFRLPQGRTRVYRNDVEASLAQNTAQTLDVPDPQINLVYLTEAMDTRFDAFSVLRPLPIGVTSLPPVTTPQEIPTEEPSEPQTPEEPGESPEA